MSHDGSVHNSERDALMSYKRKLARPVDECWRALRLNVGFLQPIAKMPDQQREEYGRHVAKTVIAELLRCGFLNDQYFDAKKAEESGAGNVVDLTKGAGT